MSFLQNHPFAVEAFFKTSVVLTYAVDRDELASFIPPCLSLDTYDRWAFIAVAMVDTTALRPKGWPAAFGRDFFLIGYRIFVRYTDLSGRQLRGLYILASETDRRLMEYLGNVFTHYHYTTTDIAYTHSDDRISIHSQRSGISLELRTGSEHYDLPPGSPFPDWQEARRYAGPLPHTFSYDPERGSVLIVQGVRQHWRPAPVQVNEADFLFLNKLNFKSITLANAFIIHDIPYHWRAGVIEKWK